MNTVSLRIPDFVAEDGTVSLDIEITIRSDGDIHDAVQLVDTLQRPLRSTDSDCEGSSSF